MDGRRNGGPPARENGPEDEATRKIAEIHRSRNLAEEEKDRLIAALLPDPEPGPGIRPGRMAGALLASLLLPPSGIFFALHFFLRHEEEGNRPALACLGLTVVSILLFRFVLLEFLAGLAGPGG